jgi:hypothetical protein
MPCKDIDLKNDSPEERPDDSDSAVDAIRTVRVHVRIKNSESCRLHPRGEIGLPRHLANPIWAAKAHVLIPVYKDIRLDATTFSKLEKGWDGGLDPASM